MKLIYTPQSGKDYVTQVPVMREPHSSQFNGRSQQIPDSINHLYQKALKEYQQAFSLCHPSPILVEGPVPSWWEVGKEVQASLCYYQLMPSPFGGNIWVDIDKETYEKTVMDRRLIARPVPGGIADEKGDGFDFNEWSAKIIEGDGGFLVWEDRECVVFHVKREVGIAQFVLRCLGNPRCEGSKEALLKLLKRHELSPAPVKEEAAQEDVGQFESPFCPHCGKYKRMPLNTIAPLCECEYPEGKQQGVVLSGKEFCRLYTEFHGEEIDNVRQVTRQAFTGEELYDFCKFIYQQPNS